MELRYNGDRLKFAIRSLAVLMIVNAIGGIISAYGIKLCGDIEVMDFEESTLDLFDQLSLMYAIVYYTVFIPNIILFIMWFRRAYYNVHQFALTPPRFTEGWASGAWFVPILSLFRPVQIMREIWLETSSYLRNKSPMLPKSNFQSIISLWWAFWIISNILANISFRLPQETMEMMKLGYAFGLVSDVLSIVSGVFLFITMKSYSELEEELQVVQDMESESDSIFY